jgi:hypothetical protein
LRPIFPDGLVETQRSFECFLDYAFVRLSAEGSVPRHQDIEEDSERPNIAFHVVKLVDYFRSHVVNLKSGEPYCPCAPAFLGSIGGEPQGRTKVYQFETQCFFVVYDIFEFDISDFIKGYLCMTLFL